MARTRHRVGMNHDHRTLSHTTPPRSAVGTVTWVQQTSGWLTAADRRVMVSRLARIQVRNVVGRVAMATHLHSGRHAYVPWERLAAPTTALTVAAEQRARQLLTAPLLNHSYRSFVFGRALGELDGVDVDTELLFAAAMLHDTGLMGPVGTADFTLKSARVAREVAEEVGLSSAASEVLQTAITMHHTPGVELTEGPVPYLLSAGAAVDVVGLRSWRLPPETLREAVREHPRDDFKKVFAEAFRQEAARVPRGRVRVLNRYGAFRAAIRFAPFDS
jgi:hypothetical protein